MQDFQVFTAFGGRLSLCGRHDKQAKDDMQMSEETGDSPLLTKARNLMRAKHMSIRTENACTQWITRFLYFHQEKHAVWIHPKDMTSDHINNFLTVDRNVAASPQNQALSAILFLFKDVLKLNVEFDAV